MTIPRILHHPHLLKTLIIFAHLLHPLKNKFITNFNIVPCEVKAEIRRGWDVVGEVAGILLIDGIGNGLAIFVIFTYIQVFFITGKAFGNLFLI